MSKTKPASNARCATSIPKPPNWPIAGNLPGLITFGFHKPGATEENAPSLPAQPVPPQIIDWLARAGEQLLRRWHLLLMIEPEPICWADTATLTAHLIQRSAIYRPLRINYDPGNVGLAPAARPPR